MIARARRWFAVNIHMGVDGFIVCALVIQAVSIAGIMPAEVWVVQPGYALIVCIGLMTLSASILFSLKSLLTQSPQIKTHESAPASTEFASSSQPKTEEPRAGKPESSVALVLQSSRTLQTIIEKSLAKAAIQSVCAADEAAALHTLETNRIDLFVTDAALFERERSALLREICQGKGIPILALTGDKTSRTQYSYSSTNLAMPIVPDELARAAMELIRGPMLEPHAPDFESGSRPQRELPKLEPDSLDARALADLEKLGGRDFVRDIVAQFVADAAAVLAGLTAAVTERDSKAFREQAHALRSCAANVGAQNVYRMCLAWRDLDAQEIAASGMRYMQMLEAEFERVRGALAPMLQQGDGSGGEDKAA